jgi:hypothetical protein
MTWPSAPNGHTYGYWDSLKKGLLSGEQLHHDLKRMDVSYLDLNRREFELTKHLSLAQIDPVALLDLKVNGECELKLSEELFDLDYPGHYLRRIKSVSLSIPCVTGPYAGVSCTLRQLRSEVRYSAAATDAASYPRDLEHEDGRFVDRFRPIQSIATSHAQNDSGLFELNLRDERYLPFEGTGAIGTWRLAMPKGLKQFDDATIADVVLHIKYTARDGGETLKKAASDSLAERLNALESASQVKGLVRAFSLRYDFPTEWAAVVSGTGGFSAKIRKSYFPYFVQGRAIGIDNLWLYDGNNLELKSLDKPSPGADWDTRAPEKQVQITVDVPRDKLPNDIKTDTPLLIVIGYSI